MPDLMDDDDVGNQGWLYLRCRSCNERVKLAKNKGTGDWVARDYLAEFLQEHSYCSIDDICLEWEI